MLLRDGLQIRKHISDAQEGISWPAGPFRYSPCPCRLKLCARTRSRSQIGEARPQFGIRRGDGQGLGEDHRRRGNGQSGDREGVRLGRGFPSRWARLRPVPPWRPLRFRSGLQVGPQARAPWPCRRPRPVRFPRPASMAGRSDPNTRSNFILVLSPDAGHLVQPGRLQVLFALGALEGDGEAVGLVPRPAAAACRLAEVLAMSRGSLWPGMKPPPGAWPGRSWPGPALPASRRASTAMPSCPLPPSMSIRSGNGASPRCSRLTRRPTISRMEAKSSMPSTVFTL